MICINGHFEAVDDLHDVSRIIRKYYNTDLAYELDKLVEEQALTARLEFLKDEIANLTDIIDAIRALVW